MREEPEHQANPGYAAVQLSKALQTAETHGDAETVARAERKAAKWMTVLSGMNNGTIAPGSRRPTAAPEWVTLEVVHGGFATGNYLSGGPLSAFEQELLQTLPASSLPPRLQLNRYFLSEAGVTELHHLLQNGKYKIQVPEEAALLTVVWLLEQDDRSAADTILDEITPWFDELRFYPQPADARNDAGTLVHVESVGNAAKKLRAVQPSKQVKAQQEALEVWAPLYDSLLALALETVDGEVPSVALTAEGKPARDESGRYQISGGWPGVHITPDWSERASDVLGQVKEAISTHKYCGKYHKVGHPFRFLCEWLAAVLHEDGMPEQRRNRVRLILGRSLSSHGVPGGDRRTERREGQREQLSNTSDFKELANILLARISALPVDGGIESPEEIFSQEGDLDQPWPKSLRRKIERCRVGTVNELVERGIIPSGDILAVLMPQITAGIRSMGMSSPELRRLYELTYRAFRRRRSLLLLNLESQIRVDEIPWLAVMDRSGSDTVSKQELALLTLRDTLRLNLRHFPHAIIPNKLLQEIRPLAKTAKLEVPVVDELAADIFMGTFTAKFVEATKISQTLLNGSLYQRYYGIEEKQWRRLDPKSFANLCYRRAGMKKSGGWGRTAENGMVIEQQQILTTQNLGTLIATLGLQNVFEEEGMAAAKSTFRWICRRLSQTPPHHHGRLIMVKNAAYAWRQMLLYLSLSGESADSFVAWSFDQLAETSPRVAQALLEPLEGLQAAIQGGTPSKGPLLGWTTGPHRLLAGLESPPENSRG